MAIGILSEAERIRNAEYQTNYNGGGTDLTLHLCKNDITPAYDTVAADFTEADFTGYASKTLTGSSFTIASSHPITAVYATQQFLSSADQTAQYIYCYYILRGSILVGSQRFPDGPYVVVANTDYVEVDPQLLY